MTAAEENRAKKSAMKQKIIFFEQNFSSLKQNLFELFFLLSYSKLCEV
jgi:hypothetical protein